MKYEEVQLGMVVILKSGGPEMTVTEKRRRKKEIVCMWFQDGNNIKAALFAPEAVTKKD